MNLIEFPEQNVVIARHQKEYLPMPAWRDLNDPQGRVICKWQISWRERFTILLTGTLWHHVLTFRGPIQPQALTTENPFTPPRKTFLQWIEALKTKWTSTHQQSTKSSPG